MAGGKSPFERQVVLFPGRQLIELDHFEAEQIRQVVGIASIRGHIMFVNQAGVERADQSPAVLDIEF